MSVLDWVGLALLGGTGALLRFGIDAWFVNRFVNRFTTTFPIATLVINTSGSFALGVLTGAHVTGAAIFLAGTGLIGSFTTFSTWIFETQRLAEKGEAVTAVWNIALTLAAGLTAAAAGWAVAALI